MASPVWLYQREIHNALACFATWLPRDKIEVGDVGVIAAGRFRRESTPTELGIPYKGDCRRRDEELPIYIDSGNTHQNDRGAATLPQVANSTISIVFSRQGAFVFHALNLRQHRLENPLTVAHRVDTIGQAESGVEEGWFPSGRNPPAGIDDQRFRGKRLHPISLEVGAGVLVPSLSLADPTLGLKVAGTRTEKSSRSSQRRASQSALLVHPSEGPDHWRADHYISRPVAVVRCNRTTLPQAWNRCLAGFVRASVDLVTGAPIVVWDKRLERTKRFRDNPPRIVAPNAVRVMSYQMIA